MPSTEQKGSEKGKGVDFFPGPEVLQNRLETSPDREAILSYLGKSGVEVDEFLPWPEKRGLYLSDLGILRHLVAGNIVICPFNPEHLTPNSYEVSLGGYFYRQEQLARRRVVFKSPERRFSFAPSPHDKDESEERFPIFNPYDGSNIGFTWREHQAVKAGDFMRDQAVFLDGVEEDDKIIILSPQEMVLAHTDEFIGGRNVVSTMISARSSTGRNLLEVCSDANLGHIGFINRWTLEVRNKSDDFAIPLVVGRRYAQISFLETEPSAASYRGQFQQDSDSDIEAIRASWNPEMMLPAAARSR